MNIVKMHAWVQLLPVTLINNNNCAQAEQILATPTLTDQVTRSTVHMALMDH